jgi:N-methylhydantoinase B
MRTRVDPVTLEVIANALPAISNEMSADLQRASYNMMIYEVRDYCCALVDTKGQLLSQNIGGVSHFVADLGVIATDAIAQWGDEGFDPGDVLITNHQAVAGQHLNNIVIFTPFFYRGELICFCMVRAHWIDVGGMSTGFGGGFKVADPWMEGLQLNQLKIYEAGKVNRTLMQILRDNIRYPESSLGDMRGQIAACHLAARRLEELFDKYGRDTIIHSIDELFSETEQKCRKVVSEIPDGEYESGTFLDDDGLTLDDPVRIHAKIIVRGSDMTIDLSGCSQQRKGAINARTFAGAVVAYKALTTPMDPVNEGSLKALKVIIPEGNMMMAKYPAPMAGWSNTLPTVVDTILTALAPAMPDKIPAAHLGVLGSSIIFYGDDPRTNRKFMVQSIEGGGWGGRPYEDGESASVSVCQGDVRNAPIESIELRCPVIVEERRLRPNSSGPGKFRGGLGLDVRVRNLAEGYWNLRQQRRTKCPPWGLWGGKPGAPGDYLLKAPSSDDWKSVDVVRYGVQPDTEALIRSAGGGGWGDPLDRAPQQVQWDVLEEIISIESARQDYGVVLNEDLSVDVEETRILREQLRQAN